MAIPEPDWKDLNIIWLMDEFNESVHKRIRKMLNPMINYSEMSSQNYQNLYLKTTKCLMKF